MYNAYISDEVSSRGTTNTRTHDGDRRLGFNLVCSIHKGGPRDDLLNNGDKAV